MKKNRIKSLISIGFISVSLLACNKLNKEETSTLPEKTGEEMMVSKISYEPDTDFEQARGAFIKNEYAASSENIQHAISYMRELARGVDEKEKQAIDQSILELEDLAKNVKTDRVEGVKELDYFFGRAFLALANSKVIAAENLVIKGNKENADTVMQEAMHHFENASQRMKKDWIKEEDSIYTSMEKLSSKMKKESNAVQSEIEHDFQKLKKDLNELEQKKENSVSTS